MECLVDLPANPEELVAVVGPLMQTRRLPSRSWARFRPSGPRLRWRFPARASAGHTNRGRRSTRRGEWPASQPLRAPGTDSSERLGSCGAAPSRARKTCPDSRGATAIRGVTLALLALVKPEVAVSLSAASTCSPQSAVANPWPGQVISEGCTGRDHRRHGLCGVSLEFFDCLDPPFAVQLFPLLLDEGVYLRILSAVPDADAGAVESRPSRWPSISG